MDIARNSIDGIAQVQVLIAQGANNNDSQHQHGGRIQGSAARDSWDIVGRSRGRRPASEFSGPGGARGISKGCANFGEPGRLFRK